MSFDLPQKIEFRARLPLVERKKESSISETAGTLYSSLPAERKLLMMELQLPKHDFACYY